MNIGDVGSPAEVVELRPNVLERELDRSTVRQNLGARDRSVVASRLPTTFDHLPPPPASSSTLPSWLGPLVRLIVGCCLVGALFVLPDKITSAFRPVVFVVAIVMAGFTAAWVRRRVSVLAVLNAFVVGVAVDGLIAASSIGSSNLGVLYSGVAGLCCLGAWTGLILESRRTASTRPAGVAFWVTPAVAVVSVALVPFVSGLRFSTSRDELTAYADRLLDVPQSTTCPINTPTRVGTYTITNACLFNGVGNIARGVRFELDDTFMYELDYGEPLDGGSRVWQAHSTSS